VSQSSDPANDALFGAGLCGSAPAGSYQDRCGYGPRLPLLAISPFARRNYVDHSITDQSSILRFIEDNWGTGRLGNQSFDAKAGSLNGMLAFGHHKHAGRLILDPATGQPKHGSTSRGSCSGPRARAVARGAVQRADSMVACEPYTSATDQDRREMLEAIGVSSIDELFDHIPEAVRLGRPLELPDGKPETEVYDRLSPWPRATRTPRPRRASWAPACTTTTCRRSSTRSPAAPSS